MASKGPRSRLDHETRARRQKALEAPREPRRPTTHWDHVLEEMVWLSKDFESERKWKLAQAKKVALRASKGKLDQALRGEKKLKEEEQRLRKVALNISKDVKKFWLKIEKLVLYKHQMELDEKKKKTLDKQLEFLLGQTERYSTMLAENLVDAHRPLQQNSAPDHQQIFCKEADDDLVNEQTESDAAPLFETAEDEDFDVKSEDELEDDEQTLEDDEALITEEERREELAALHNEIDVPIEDLLKRYAAEKGSRETSPEMDEASSADTSDEKDLYNGTENDLSSAGNSQTYNSTGRRCDESNGSLFTPENNISEVAACQMKISPDALLQQKKQELLSDFREEQEDGDFILAGAEEKDDEATLSEEEELARVDPYDPMDEIALLQKESEVPVEELLARYRKDYSNGSISEEESEYASILSEDSEDCPGSEPELTPQAVSINENDEVGEGPMPISFLREQEAETGKKLEVRESDSRIEDAAAAARSAQPTGNTYSTTQVRTKLPFLLKHSLREYQHIGLDWLVTMYEKRLNGILADEMGLGKTIMTIALLAHLACEKGIWGPHLIIVPTSVMLNWETEFLKWCPAFKILTYFGSAKERKFKRQGWLKPNSFHVCITTYRLVIQDAKVFKRKKWKYLILDEAHLIKNWKSQRWQTLLNFHSKRRILLTGTPLQNDLMELWSLMHFLMPHVFQSHQEFKDWFCNPISGMVEGQEKVNKEVIDRLHNVLRPFILRRLKRDVEKQLPMKREHVLYCRLSRRQRNLYEDFIASSETQATLASANFFGMISVIMQLRKVCNHPDLFEGRPILSSFDMSGLDIQLSSSLCFALCHGPFARVDLQELGFVFTHLDYCMSIETPSTLIKERVTQESPVEIRAGGSRKQRKSYGTNIFEEIHKAIQEERSREARERAASIAWWNSLRCYKKPMYSTSFRDMVTIKHPIYDIHHQKADRSSYLYSSKLAEIVLSPVERFQRMIELVESFMFAIPAARSLEPICWCTKKGSPVLMQPAYTRRYSEILLPLLSAIRPAIVRRQVYFPDRRLIQFDCGKLQELAILLRRLKSEGHRALIFTQMTKMLDVLEAFISIYGYTYMRLDGSTQPEERQTLMQRFNTNPKIFLFILSTRSGGVGINLVGADTVIFYDSDWNPAMDQQAQDRCHRIGQTREVHIYRLISESTIEENILKKAKQKRALDDLVIQSGGYNTEFFKKLDPMELFSGHRTLQVKSVEQDKNDSDGVDVLSNADVEAALKNAEDEADYMALKKVEEEEAVDNQEFTEEAIGKMEDDEFVNEDDLKDDEPAEQGVWSTNLSKNTGMIISGGDLTELGVTSAEKEDDVDILADVKQMAKAAAASGHAISSFEGQLRPIDRYAIRLLELWDPITDKASLESKVTFEETQWELDRIERYKEEMEAEIDDDEEPFVYERWDADFATEAYRQQVEALAQEQQLIEEMEMEAKEKENAETENYDDMMELPRSSKSKSKKKVKKAKFKSLKKGSSSSEAKTFKEELVEEAMSLDDDLSFNEGTYSLDADAASPHSATTHRKRKVDKSIQDSEEKPSSRKKSKKQKTVPVRMLPLDSDYNHSIKQLSDSDYEQRVDSRSRLVGGKVSITSLPTKRVVLIRVEKFRKGDIWPKDRVPSSDLWSPQEDAILCAMVHEYGPNWGLVCDALFGMAGGGYYRGRYRHPVLCSERFRELIQTYILSPAEKPNNEKGGGQIASAKALLRMTEDNMQTLLDGASELPDNELLLQKHFTALLSTVWKVTPQAAASQNNSSSSSKNGLLYFGGRFFKSRGSSQTSQKSAAAVRDAAATAGKLKLTNSVQTKRLLAAALHDAATDYNQNDMVCVSDKEEESEASVVEEDQLELTLQFQQQEKDDLVPLLPTMAVKLSIPAGSEDNLLCKGKTTGGDSNLKSSRHVAESRFWVASQLCSEGSVGWASSAFPMNDGKSQRNTQKQQQQVLGKHKLSTTTTTTSDSAKPSKSKSRKTNLSMFNTGNHQHHHSMYELILSPMPMQTQTVSFVGHPNLKFDFVDGGSHSLLESSGGIGGAEEDDGQSNFLMGLKDEEELLPLGTDMVPHDYDPLLLYDLEDCSLLPEECTDIG